MKKLPPRLLFAHLAITLDGKLDSVLREGGGFSSRADRDRVDAFRAEADALVVGAETVRREDPPLRIRSENRRRVRREQGRGEDLTIVVLSRSGALSPGARFLRESAAARILALPEDVPDASLQPLRPLIEEDLLTIWRGGRGGVDIPGLLRALEAEGHSRILVEGGGRVVTAFLEAGLLDELRVTLCPALLGGDEAPALMEGPGRSITRRHRLKLVELDREGDEIFLRYHVLRQRETTG